MLYYNFSITILVIDGTHISITYPTNSRGKFMNTKGRVTINFLIVADVNFKIRYLFGGKFRSSNDSNVLKLSKFKE
ncbi:hypothetical protein HERIO_2528 [Hepatospora eriocheir]|uniref:DDE Tnp4 domain-containing protein n=1 Tax=Hepatospora eriocheir TaxID=1081669 RepID=A0A1X0Q6M3_9MICR|nr:hypothetical protein HERIO_2528 [Hepatospora eriocheir]